MIAWMLSFSEDLSSSLWQLDTRCMWRVPAYFLEYLWHKSQKYHNSIILNHMNTCTLARFQCIYAWFAFSIAKASKASKLLCRVFGPKCDYDGDIVIWYFVYARMCVVQALLALGFISSLRQRGTSQLFGGCVCNMHSVLCSMLLVFLFLVSKFLAFSWTILVSMFLVFQCFLFFLKNYVSMFLVFLWKIKFFNSRIVQYQESCSPQSFAEAHQLLVSNLARTSCHSFIYDIIYELFTISSNRLDFFFRHRYT